MEPEMLPARWGVVRAEWLFHPAVGVDEFAMLACLSTYLDREGYCWPSQKTLATRLKKSRPWVIKVLNHLVEAGLVVRTRRERKDGGLRSCLYRMASPDFAGAAPEADALESVQAAPEQPCPERDKGCPGGDRNHQHKNQISLSRKRASAQSAERIIERASDQANQDPATSRSVARPVPDGWAPSAEDLAWAAEAYPDMDAATLTEAFVHASGAKGYAYIDFSCAWRSWFANQRRWKEERHDRFARSRTEQQSRQEQENPRTAGGPRKAGASGPDGAVQRGRAVPDHSSYQRGGSQPSLAERNGVAADACLERLLARRAGSGSAGKCSAGS